MTILTPGQEVSFWKHVSEGKLLYQAASREQKIYFTNAYLTTFETYADPTKMYTLFAYGSYVG